MLLSLGYTHLIQSCPAFVRHRVFDFLAQVVAHPLPPGWYQMLLDSVMNSLSTFLVPQLRGLAERVRCAGIVQQILELFLGEWRQRDGDRDQVLRLGREDLQKLRRVQELGDRLVEQIFEGLVNVRTGCSRTKNHAHSHRKDASRQSS